MGRFRATHLEDGGLVLVERRIVPHILIYGRPILSDRLPKLLPKRPIPVASSEIFRHFKGCNIYIPKTTRLFMYKLIRWAETGQDPDNVLADLRDVTDAARRRFALKSGEPVQIVCAGSHGSIWNQEHSTVGTGGCLDRDEAATDRLGEMARNRDYIASLYHALGLIDGIEIRWLTEAFPEYRAELIADRPGHCANPTYENCRHIAELARTALAEDEQLAQLNGAVSLIYTKHSGHSQWLLFTEDRGAGNAPGPYRTTNKLIEQYGTSFARERKDTAVLVKLLPKDERRHNPCDNPIIELEQLRTARVAGIAAVLLDKDRGFLDLYVYRTPQGDVDERPLATVYAF